MKVILLQDVKALGKKGQTVDVSDGYARNCILPKKLGVEATSKNLNDLKLQKAHEEKVAKEQLEEAKAFAAKMADMEVIVSIKSGKDGRTFGSVSSKEIAENLEKSYNIKIDKKKIDLKETIKTLGVRTVEIKLYEGVIGKLKIDVIS